ncbi:MULTISPECIES: hypothetical protein [unclassified Vibrio]|uniref:TIGR04219 family outer membrane beta-barrel protein n=1 Tax=Vibrio sp. HB236076 TaxID=3232307 RepID=A0AB39HF99_9VIBR|nr:hypothetical protein [Vibrio sp. HB161653]MDP5255483.1 hypothetical protein [Vibrio sp. HB161653]
MRKTMTGFAKYFAIGAGVIAITTVANRAVARPLGMTPNYSFYTVKVAANSWWADSNVDGVLRTTKQVPSLGFAFETGFIYWPNLGFEYSQLDTFHSQFDKYDVSLYYPLVNQYAWQLDLGLTWTKLKDGLYINADETQQGTFEEQFFNGFMDISVPLPWAFYGWDLFGKAVIGGQGGVKQYDTQYGLQYHFPYQGVNVTLKGGYRDLELSFSGTQNTLPDDASIDLDGWFVGAQLAF